MGPAPLQASEAPIHLGPITVDDAIEAAAEQILGRLTRAAESAGEKGERGGHKGPHPRLGLAFLGRRFVNVQGRLRGQLFGQFLLGRRNRLGGPILQQDHPSGAGGLLEDRAQEQGRPAFGLAKAGHEDARKSAEPRTSLAGRHARRQLATGGAAARAEEAMPLVFGNNGLDVGKFPDLMAKGLGIAAAERFAAASGSVPGLPVAARPGLQEKQRVVHP